MIFKKYFAVILFFLLFIYAEAIAQNKLWIDTLQAGKGQTVKFSAKISNSEQFNAFQLDIILPVSLIYINSSVKLSGRAQDHQITASLLSDQKTLRVISYSASSANFSGNSGTVFTFECNVNPEAAPGNYPLVIANALISDSSGKNILTGINDGSFTFISPKININQSSIDFGRVPLGQSPLQSITISNTGNALLNISSFSSNSAEIKFTDSSSAVIQAGGSIQKQIIFNSQVKGTKSVQLKIISNDPVDSQKVISVSGIAYAINEIHVGTIAGRSGTRGQLKISVNNMEPFTALELSLNIPSQMKYVPASAKFIARNTDHVIAVDTTNKNNLKIIAYSPGNNSFTGNNGELLSLDFDLSGQGGYYPINITNAIISSPDGSNIISASYSGSLTISSPRIYLPQTSYTFNSISVLDSSQTSIAVQNTGDDTLKISSVNSDSEKFKNTTILPLIILPNSSGTISVRYHSSVKGNFTGKLTLVHNDVVNNPSVISLSGSSFNPNQLVVNSTQGVNGTIIPLSFSINNYDQFVAFQFDVQLPTGVTYQTGSAVLSSRAADHSISASVLSNGNIRFISYSLNQSPFTGNSGEVLRFNVLLNNSSGGSFPVTLSNVVIGDSKNQNVLSGFTNGTVTILIPPAAPNLSSPSNGSTGVSISPVLSWQSVTGADSYRLQAGTDSTFTTGIVYDDSTLTAVNKQLTGLLNSTKYYWRVRAKNIAGVSNWSAVFNFTTIIAVPGVPILQTPINNSTNQSTNLTLSWGAVTTATSYHLQLATDSSFTNMVINDTNLTTLNKQVSSLSNSTKYYWRVSAKNAGGEGSWSTVFNFTTIISGPSVPVLQSPSNGSTGVSISPTLSWNAVTGADSYRLQAGTDSTFTTGIVYDDSTLTAVSKQLTGLLNSTKYYWRVRAKNAGGIGGWSVVFGFMTIIKMISAPTNLASDVNQINKVILTWTDNSNNESGFKLERTGADGNTFSLLVSLHSDTTSFLDSTVQEGKTYKYRIKAYNQNVESLYSNESIILTPVSSINPPSDVKVTADTAGHFEITWRDNSTNESGFIINRGIVDSIKTSTTIAYGIFSIDKITDIIPEYSPLDTLPANSTKYTDVSSKEGIYYKYKVVAYNLNGVSLGKTDTTKMNIITLLAPSNLESSLEVKTKIKVLLTWKNNSLIAQRIVIEKADNNPAKFTLIDTVKSNVTNYVDSLVENLHTYYYRLKAYDNSVTSAYSGVTSKTILTDLNYSGNNLPKDYALLQNYPNPFNPSTVIKYDLPKVSFVTLKIYDVLGREVRTLVNEDKPAGRYEVNFNADNLASGIYLYRIQAGNYVETKKLMVIK